MYAKKGNRGQNDGLNTPPWLVRLLPYVDLDPCSNITSIVKSHVRLTLEAGDDGLEDDWNGHGRSVFLNPPYSKPGPWVRKLSDFVAQDYYWRSGFALLKGDPSTSWWRPLQQLKDFRQAECYWFKKRMKFYQNNEPTKLSASFPSTLWCLGRDAMEHIKDNWDEFKEHLWLP